MLINPVFGLAHLSQSQAYLASPYKIFAIFCTQPARGLLIFIFQIYDILLLYMASMNKSAQTSTTPLGTSWLSEIVTIGSVQLAHTKVGVG